MLLIIHESTDCQTKFKSEKKSRWSSHGLEPPNTNWVGLEDFRFGFIGGWKISKITWGDEK